MRESEAGERAGTPLIELEDASYSYDGTRDALSHVSLSVAAGEWLCVLGANGSGKSTLARCLNGLIVPDSGVARVAGVATSTEAGMRAARRQVGMVFQNPDDQLVASSVADDVAFGPENLGLPQPKIARRVDEALAQVGMAAFAQADPVELSGGQKQRVALAGALAMEPRALVLDEAGAMLDPEGRATLAGIVGRLHEAGTTIVSVTHFMDDALLADRVIVLDAGRIALEGAPDEVFAREEELAALGLELPFAARLARSLRALGVDEPRTSHLDALEEALWPR